MAGAKSGANFAASLARRQLAARSSQCARRFASTNAEKPSSSDKVDALSELEQSSSFLTPPADDAAINAFNTKERLATREKQLPGTRSVDGRNKTPDSKRGLIRWKKF